MIAWGGWDPSCSESNAGTRRIRGGWQPESTERWRPDALEFSQDTDDSEVGVRHMHAMHMPVTGISGGWNTAAMKFQ